jgi:hypothetical protein
MEKQTREEKNRKKAEYWRSHIEVWRKSGLSQIDYCRNNNLSRCRFTYWKCKDDKQSKPMTFIPVLHKPSKIPRTVKNTAPLKVLMGDRYRIEIGDGFTPETLSRLMYTLERM